MKDRYAFDTYDEWDLDPSHRPAVVEEIEYAFEAFGVGRGSSRTVSVSQGESMAAVPPSLEKP